jgi:hypothetical protein
MSRILKIRAKKAAAIKQRMHEKVNGPKALPSIWATKPDPQMAAVRTSKRV